MEDIIMVKARRCLECGKLLVSNYGLQHGRGHICKKKYDAIHALPDPDQITFFDKPPHESHSLTVNELFSGIGAQRAALKRLGIPHEVVGISEIDKYAIKSYEAIYGETRNYGDISKVDKLDYADFWTYSFPCTDISVAGQQKGIVKGVTRSGLLYEVQRLLEKAQETDSLPKYLMLENVKNLVGKKFKAQFEEWLEWLNQLGYSTYWQVLNAKNYGVPQNRERVFAISIRKDVDTGNFNFPEPFNGEKRLKDVLETDVDERFYLSAKMVQGFIKHNEKHSDKGTGFIWKPRELDGNASALRANGALAPTDNTIIAGSLNHYGNDQMNRVYSAEGLSPTITTVSGGGREQKVMLHEPVICASRGRNPDNPSDRTAGAPTEQRLEVNVSGTSNTITTVQKDNYVFEPFNTEPGGTARTIKAQYYKNSAANFVRSDSFAATGVLDGIRIRKLTPASVGGSWVFQTRRFARQRRYAQTASFISRQAIA